ncbi:MAG: hypothetical protein DRJ51_02220 [Thermoprotei archaeon]|mgnify:CR=1 FL=1|nr:MAG: hypothetical protein DRJ51_02220 [Thermoprotei archaeon]
MTVNLAIIGAGGMGRAYIKAFKQMPEANVIAVVDVDEKRAREVAKEYGVPEYYSDWRKVVKKDEIDAVAVCTPVKFHKEITVGALNSGKHVMCEKPPAMNAVEAEEMARAAKENNRILMYGFQWRFMEKSRYIRKLVQEGFFGHIYRARIHYLRQFGIPLGADGWFRTRSLAGGGVLIDCGVHLIDLTYWLTGRPKPILAFGKQYDYIGRRFTNFDVEDTYIGLVLFENGMSMVVEASWAQNWHNEHGINIYGTLAGASIYPQVEIVKKIGDVYTTIKPEIKEAEAGHLKLKHFIEAIGKGYRDISPTPEDGVVVMKILDALYRASEEGKVIEIT